MVVVALETGSRWSDEATKFFCELAGSRAREVGPLRVVAKVDEDVVHFLRQGLREFFGSRSEAGDGHDGPASCDVSTCVGTNVTR